MIYQYPRTLKSIDILIIYSMEEAEYILCQGWPKYGDCLLALLLEDLEVFVIAFVRYQSVELGVESVLKADVMVRLSIKITLIKVVLSQGGIASYIAFKKIIVLTFCGRVSHRSDLNPWQDSVILKEEIVPLRCVEHLVIVENGVH